MPSILRYPDRDRGGQSTADTQTASSSTCGQGIAICSNVFDNGTNAQLSHPEDRSSLKVQDLPRHMTRLDIRLLERWPLGLPSAQRLCKKYVAVDKVRNNLDESNWNPEKPVECTGMGC